MPSHHEGTEDERAALDAFIKLSRAAHSVGARSSRSVAASGLTGSQFGVLDALYHLGPLPLGDIARKHLSSPNNITTVVDNMERSGLVERLRCPEDRRVVRAVLTDKGRSLFESLWPDHLREIVEAMAALSPEEQRTLADLCKRVGLGLVREPPPSADLT
jgi:MarR family 2-MHQ and catechol resistance regulon transcriptional repressor